MAIIRNYKITSNYDGLELGMTVVAPEGKMKGAVIFSHGMAEHRLRYLDFMNFLANHGYLAIIHDHRGHGESVKTKKDYGYFYENGKEGLVSDLNQILDEVNRQYPNIPYYLFSHSMGTLVARKLIQEHDFKIDGLILSGPPSKNKNAKIGKLIVKGMMLFHRPHYRSPLLQKLTFKGYGKRFKNEKNKNWLCSNMDEIKKYKKSELCGFTFTLNGFYTLYSLVEEAYQKKYQCHNKKLPILMIAGSDDPVIINGSAFLKTKEFLEQQGYENVRAKLYEKGRHEILFEEKKKEIYKDILNFLDENGKKKLYLAKILLV